MDEYETINNLDEFRSGIDENHSSKEWNECFFKHCVKQVSPCVDRLASVAQKKEPVEYYLFYIGTIDGNFKKLKELESNVQIQVNLTLLDMTYRQYFGRTWMGPLKTFKNNLGTFNGTYDEPVYFSTSIKDEHILLVIELVVKLRDGKKNSFGWTTFRPFSSKESSSQDVQRLGIYAGTPRSLLFLDDPFEKSKYLKEITGSYLNYRFNSKPKLAVMQNFIPENVLLGRTDKIGGLICDHSRHPLEKPNLYPQYSIIIDELFIYLNPNVSKFENELCKLIAEDKSLWDKIEIEPSLVTIFERRLKIGVHNGWKYVHEPHIVHLSVDDPLSNQETKFSTIKRMSLKSSMKPITSETDTSNAPTAKRLIMRNALVLNEIFEDPMCAIVFEIEYVINLPTHVNVLNTINKKSISDTKKQYQTHNILVRWGVYCPFANSLKKEMDHRVEINMFGTGIQTNNPESKLVFKRPDTNMQDSLSSKTAPGKITFYIKKGNQVILKQRYNEIDEPPEMETRDDAELYSKVERRRPRQTTDTFGQLNDTQQKSVNDLYNQMIPQKQEDYLISSQANLLMNQLITRASDSQRLVGLFGGNLELYPIFNPSLHMPVLALPAGQIGGRTMSRAAYAKLQSANFPQIYDRFGKIAEVIDGNSYLQFDLQKEESDMLTSNQIIFQFLAFSRTIESMKSGKSELRPKNVFLTFQFYRFPEFKTPKLELDKIINDYSFDSETTPFILKTIEKENTSNDRAGYMIYFNVDPTILKYGEKKIFLQYLAHQAMFIDVWDANSLHLIGTATLQLKELLRQGREAVQATYELDILGVEYDDDSRLNSGNTYQEGTAYSNDSHIKLRGLLHVRVANVGSPVDDINDPIKQTSLAPLIPFTRVIASKSALNPYGENLLAKKIDETTSKGFVSHNLSKAHHMTETFKDIHAALVSENNKNLADAIDPNLDPLKKRKLTRMQMVRKLNETPEIAPQLLGNHRRIIEERNKDLKIMEFYRNQTKHDQIINKLHEFITSEYAIYPNFGWVEFFEFVITNPYNEAQTVTIIIDDPEIQVVTDSREWRHLKLLNQIYSQVEDNMFNREEIDPNNANIKYPQIFLRPKETINIPFKYQSFKADNKPDNSNETSNLKADADSLIRHVPHKYELKKAHIYFRAQDRNPIAILRLIIDQQPHVINQTFRFNECEHSFLKKTIRIPSSVRALASESTMLLSGDIKLDGTSTEAGVSQMFVRTSDPNVVCESRPVTIGEPHDIFIKVATGPSPTVKKFYVAIYADQYLAVPVQIWQVYVHSLHRIDVSCSLGQTSRFSIILKGTQSSRLVKCFPSIPEEMSIVPQDKFMLGSNAVQELNMGIQPNRSGIKHYYLNVVDIEASHLVQSWLIYANCKPPIISKSFELTLPTSTNTSLAAISSQKRVSYTNPYSAERVFILSTNRDDLLTFKERRVKFLANEQKTLSLRFLPNVLTGFVEIYVFINNENDTNEETFALRVHYVKATSNSEMKNFNN